MESTVSTNMRSPTRRADRVLRLAGRLPPMEGVSLKDNHASVDVAISH